MSESFAVPFYFAFFACIRWFDAMRIESVWLDNYITMCLLEAENFQTQDVHDKREQDTFVAFYKLGQVL